MDGLVEKYWQIPPITRNLTTVVFFFSLACYTGLLPFMEFIYLGPLIFKMPPQLWRLATSSIITGKDLSILFDTYWLYQYLKQLETGHPKFPKKSDLVWYLLFVLAVIQILCVNVVGILVPAYRFLSPLLVAIVYTATQDQRGQQAGFFFFTIPAQLVPYAMILINLFFPGGIYAVFFNVTGVVAAHLYDFLTRLYPQFGGGTNMIPTPSVMSFVDKITGDDAPLDIGTGQGPLPDSWRTRGSGRRLG